MVSNKQSVTEDGVYFTSKENLDKAIKGNIFGSVTLEPKPEYEVSDSSSADISNLASAEYYEYGDIGGEYILPPQNRKTIPSQSDITPKITTKKRDVKSMYDENQYALPDINGCVTKGTGVLKQDVIDKKTRNIIRGNRK